MDTMTSGCSPSAFVSSLCFESLPAASFPPISIFLLLCSFFGLAITCDEFLVPALEVLCLRCNLSEDIAGVTFMALGSAAPEIVINAVGTMKSALSATGEDAAATNLGVGAIIGSGIIAFTIIPGLCALSVTASAPLILKRRPLIRDVGAYFVSLLLLLYAMNRHPSGKIDTNIAGVFLVLYAVFIFFVFVSPKINANLKAKGSNRNLNTKRSFVLDRIASQVLREELSKQRESDALTNANYGAIPTIEEAQDEEMEKGEEGACEAFVKRAWTGFEDEHGGDDEAEETLFGTPTDTTRSSATSVSSTSSTCYSYAKPFVDAVVFLFSLLACVIRSVLMLTIPRSHVKSDGTPSSNLYPLSFLASFVWVSFFSFVISTVVERYVIISGIGGGYYGVVLVCLGAEVPDAIQCVSVAKRGYGSMAIANVVGSQVINILIGLGLPWFISGMAGLHVKVKGHDDLTGAGGFLIGCIVAFSAMLIVPIAFNCKKPRLSKWKGRVMSAWYVLTLLCYSLWYFLLIKDELKAGWNNKNEQKEEIHN